LKSPSAALFIAMIEYNEIIVPLAETQGRREA
jgi:hypothetical protein